MQKKSIILTIFLIGLLLGIVSSSGCIKTTPANSTFGEKKISLDALKVVNNTTAENYDWDGKNYYYVEGYIKNNNPLDALNVKINATFFDVNGSQVTTNNSLDIYIEPKSIPANGVSYFYIEIPDPKMKIVDYKIKVISAQAEL